MEESPITEGHKCPMHVFQGRKAERTEITQVGTEREERKVVG